MSNVVLSFDWQSHEHAWVEREYHGSDCYCDLNRAQACLLCENAAKQIGIPENKHYEHPKGCKCYWCTFCRCSEVCRRDGE